jgi:hypothetical protein
MSTLSVDVLLSNSTNPAAYRFDKTDSLKASRASETEGRRRLARILLGRRNENTRRGDV